MVQFNRLVKQKHKFSSTIKLISNRKCIHSKEYLKTKLFLPEQLVPFPVYPLLQAHVNDPAVFVQVALLSQLWVLREPSSLSKWEKDKI